MAIPVVESPLANGKFLNLILSLSSKKPVQKRNPGDYSHPIQKISRNFLKTFTCMKNSFVFVYELETPQPVLL